MVCFFFQCVNDRTSTDGKSGLEVLMLIIENGLNSTFLDENQGILAGPLIADLVQKVFLVHVLIFRRVEKYNLIYPVY